MIGAIIGDIVGSPYEFYNHRSKEFTLFTNKCFATDDSIMTLAVAKAIMEAKKAEEFSYNNLSNLAIKYIQSIGRNYPNCGFGGNFINWIFSNNPQPYNSFGNGSAMRVSPAGFIAKTLEEALNLAEAVTKVSHNHPEGIKGAKATVECIFMAKNGNSINEIREMVNKKYYDLNFTIDEIRPTYRFNETCQNTVPQAIQAFLESSSFEDAIRTAISVGGDSDTLAAITGGIAEAYYGVPKEIKTKALSYLNKELLSIFVEWESFILSY